MLPALKVLDWNATGKVTEARHQQSRGSCWVFAAMGAIESKLLINTKTTASLVPTLNLAEQQIVSAIQCAPTHGQPGKLFTWLAASFVSAPYCYSTAAWRACSACHCRSCRFHASGCP